MFLRFCEVLGKRSVTEFNYRYSDVKAAQVFVSLATQGRMERDALLAEITAAGFAARDMTDNEMAKLHVRYMVGGHAPGSPMRSCTVSNFLSAPGRCSSSCRPSARSGTSVCSTIEITVPTTAACSPGSRCPQKLTPIFYCTSTNCSTRTRKKRTIPPTGYFWAAELKAGARSHSCWLFVRHWGRQFFARPARVSPPHRQDRVL